jgi:sulfotransferase
MENKIIHFLSGLPRSGSTLLSNILMQNPEFDVCSTSGLADVQIFHRNQWQNIVWHRAMDRIVQGVKRDAVSRAIFQAYHADSKSPVVFDKNRGWPAHAEFIAAHYSENFRMILTVRDIREVLASFEKLFRRTAKERQPPTEMAEYFATLTALDRALYLLRANQLVGAPVCMIQDIFGRGFGKNCILVDFDDLCKSPERVMQEIYEFLEKDYFPHDFKKVEQKTKEDDFVHGWTLDLHEIRPEVKPLSLQFDKVFGDTVISSSAWMQQINPVKNFWKTLKTRE